MNFFITNKRQKTADGLINNESKIFPNYLDHQILKSIIDYLLIYNKKKNNSADEINEYTTKRYYYYKDDILLFSLVSKKWFEIISNLVSNNYNYNITIENYIYDNNNTTINNKENEIYYKKKSIKLIINQIYSIIKINKQIQPQNLIINYQNDIIKTTLKPIDFKSFKKVIINSTIRSIEYIKPIILLGKNNNIEINFINSSFLNTFETSSEISNEDLNYIKTMNINKLIIQNADITTFKYLEYIQPRVIEYLPNGYNFCKQFHSTLLNSKVNKRIESIKISNNHIEPIQLSTIHQLSRLHTLSIPILFHDIIKCIRNDGSFIINENGCDHLNKKILQNNENLTDDWEIMINSLSTNKTLRNLTIKNLCENDTDCLEYEIDDKEIRLISNGIKKLLIGTNNNIQYLKFDDMPFMDSFSPPISTYSPLINNTTLKTLVLDHYISNRYSLEYLISKVFTENTTLNHFKLSMGCEYSFFFNLIIKYQNKFNGLYSIELKEIDECYIDDIFDAITPLLLLPTSSSSLKEINLNFLYEVYKLNSIKQDEDNIKEKLNNFKNKINNKWLVLNVKTKHKLLN